MQAIILRLKIVLAVFLVIMILGTVGFVLIEKKTVVESAYFVIVTVATVGYGDIHPATQLGRIFTIFPHRNWCRHLSWGGCKPYGVNVGKKRD